MQFFEWKKSEPNLSKDMIDFIEKRFNKLNVEEAELLVIAKVKITENNTTDETIEIDGVKYSKLFFP